MSHPVTNLRRLQSLARRPLGVLALAAACFATFSRTPRPKDRPGTRPWEPWSIG